jgi:hypothetical protein
MSDKETKDCMTFMGYNVQGMTRDGLLEVIKWQKWEKGNEVGCLEDAPDIDYDKIAQKPTSLPRKEVISIQPGDVVVLTSKLEYSLQGRNTLNGMLMSLFPNNKTVLLINGDTMEVYRERESHTATGKIDTEGFKPIQEYMTESIGPM